MGFSFTQVTKDELVAEMRNHSRQASGKSASSSKYRSAKAWTEFRGSLLQLVCAT
jgi:hypothetical protein